MNHVQLGTSNLHVSPICLGTMTFGEQVNEVDSHAILSRALERGINFIDTAEMYSVPTRAETYSVTESIIGRWFASNPGTSSKVVLATKVHASMGDDVNRGGNSRRWIIAEVENSLRRLRTDWIDLYQIHRPDPSTDIDETLAARKQWLADHLQVRGRLILDPGAVKALREQRKSLLPIGVFDVAGEFERGEVVGCCDPAGTEIARGLVNYSAAETRRILKTPSSEIQAKLGYVDEPELIHRDNLVLL